MVLKYARIMLEATVLQMTGNAMAMPYINTGMMQIIKGASLCSRIVTLNCLVEYIYMYKQESHQYRGVHVVWVAKS